MNGARTLRCPSPVAVPANDTVASRPTPSTPSTPSSSRPCGAKEWIAAYLSAHGGEAVAAEVIEAGRPLGFPASTLKNARPKVADTVRIGFGRAQKTYWRLRAGLGTTAGAPPARTPGLTDTADPAVATESTEPAPPAAALGPSDTASSQQVRAFRPRRRPGGAAAPGQGAQQPTLFAVMGVSEP
jgi:hypothetical protein